jgi:hypothetical protein
MGVLTLTKKNEDGSYDYSEQLFDAIDPYDGDHVYKTIEIKPTVSETAAKYVKFRLVTEKEGDVYIFKPTQSKSHLLASSQYNGFKFYLEDINGIKYIPDTNGIISLVNTLTSPMDIVLHLIAEKYAVEDLEQELLLEDVFVEVWSKK